MSNLGTITYTTNIETAQLVSGTKAADKQLDSLQGSFDRTDKAAAQLGGGLSRLATSIAGVLSVAAVVNEFKKAIAVTMEFNATISNLSALTGAVGKDLEVFRQAAIDIGGSTSLSATQAAEAMKLIGSASPDLLKSADSLKAVTQQAVTLAEAAGSTLPEAAAALTGALNQFQLGADQAGRVINVLAAGAKEGASEINDTVAAMKDAGVVAAQAGLSFEQFNGAIQALAQGQIKAGEAGTGLRNILTILNTQAKSEFKPSVVGLSTALANLEKAGLDDTQMVKLFGRENITTAKVLLQFRGTMDNVTTAITGTSEAYKQAAINQDNLKGDVANLSSAFETLQITIGDLSDSTLRDLTKQLTDVLSSFGSNKDALASFFNVAGDAALSFAAVITGRVVTGLAGFATAQAAAVKATLEQVAASQQAAAADLALARAEDAAAKAALAKTVAIQAANSGMKLGSANADQLAAAEARAAAATTNLNAALAASAGVATKSSIALGLLGKATSFLGGPLGVFLLAATAVAAFSRESAKARVEVDALNGSLETLSFNQMSRASQEVKEEIVDLNGQLAVARNNFNSLSSDKAVLSAEAFAKKQTEVRAALDDVNQAIALREKRLDEIAAAQDKITNKPQAPAVNPTITPVVSETSEDGQKAIDTLKEQLALAKLTGEAKARLQAIQKLGSAATEKEKAEAAALGAEIYKLETATKSLDEANKKQKTNAEQLAKRAAQEEKKGIESNLEVFSKLGAELASVGQSARELAQDQAQLALNKYATPEQIQSIRDIAGAFYDAKTAKDTLARVDPAANAAQGYQQQLKDLQTVNDMKLLSDTDYLALKEQAETEYNDRMFQIEQQRFAAQSAGNQALIDGLDALGQAGTQALGGILSGTMSLQDALGNIANTVLNAVIGSFVQAGVEWVKQQIVMASVGQATAAAATAASVAEAAIVSAAWAPAAAFASLASFGANAAPAAAALTSTSALASGLSMVSGKALGGPVQAGGMYRVNETGAPEIFNAANGRQYMMPNSRGDVVSNKDASSGGGGAGNAPVINNHNYSGQTMQSTAKFSEQDRRWVIDTIVGDMMGDGRTSRATNQITGTRRQGV
jgi:TP901 family phage tail tape measure protein